MDHAEASSPIPGPSNYQPPSHRLQLQPPILRSEPLLPSHSPPPTRRRLSSRSCGPIRSFPRKTYRQATLSECLSPSLSSPLAPRTLSTNLQTQSSPQQHENLLIPSDHDPPDGPHASNPIQRPPLVPLVFNSDQPTRSFPRSRLNQITCSSPDRVSSLLPSCLPSSPLNPSKIPRKRHLNTIDFFESELNYRKPFRFDSEFARRIKFLESLTSNPETQTIKLWNSEYEHGYEFPFSLAFNHKAQNGDVGAPPAQGELMAVGTALGTISLYHPSEIGSTEDRSPVTKLEGIQNGIFALTFSSSDLMLATGSGAQVSEIFDVETGNLIGRLEGHGGTVKTVEFSPYNEQMIVTGSRDGSVKLWDLRTVGTQSGDDGFPAYPPVLTIQNAHDEKHTGRKRKKGVHIPSVSSVLWSRLADRHLYSAGSANGVVKLWDVRKKSEFNPKKAHPSPADQSVDYQSLCDILGSMEGDGQKGEFEFDATTSQRPHGISSLVSSSDGARIYALGTDSRIQTHDPLFLSRPPSSRLRSFSHPSLIATSLYLKLSLTKDDDFLACSSSTGELYIWDTTHPSDSYHPDDLGDDLDYLVECDGIAKKSRSPAGPVILLGHQKEVCALQFWRQGLASCSDDSSVRIWSYHDALLQPL